MVKKTPNVKKKIDNKVNNTKKSNSFAIVSMILGICSLIIPFLGLILGVLAIIFSVKQSKIEKNGMSTAGLILGIIGIITSVIYVFLMLLVIMVSVGTALTV